MSFVGGGSDIPQFYNEFGGAVISTSIDKYIYINVNRKFDQGIRIAYSKTEEVSSVAEIEHKLVKATLEFLKIEGGIELTSIADIPAKGTGLGSSSTFTVGLLNALNAYLGKFSSKEYLGATSSFVEIEICKEPIGKQNQYAAAYGGLNLIEFNKNDSVNVIPIIFSKQCEKILEDNLIMFYTGITRNASSILQQQTSKIVSDDSIKDTLKKMVKLTYDLYSEMQNENIDSFGEILHENWQLKKAIATEISNDFINDAYESALKAGATGGKILGAGAGGFLLFYAPKEKHNSIRNSLKHLREIPFNFDKAGSQIIFYQ